MALFDGSKVSTIIIFKKSICNFSFCPFAFRILAITDKSFKISYTAEGKNEKLEDDEISFVNKEELNQKQRNVWDTEKSIFNKQSVYFM